MVGERNHETKASFKTTEFGAMIVLVASILISAAVINGGDNGTDEFIARNAWLYVSILGAGYFISRGLAKSGSYEPDEDVATAADIPVAFAGARTGHEERRGWTRSGSDDLPRTRQE